LKYVLGWGKQLNRGVKKRSEKGEEKEGERKKKKNSTEISKRFNIYQKSPWSLLTVFVCDKQQTFN